MNMATVQQWGRKESIIWPPRQMRWDLYLRQTYMTPGEAKPKICTGWNQRYIGS